jgi:hypothetical protein
MKVLVSWSSGKDSAWMVRQLRAQSAPIGGLLTTINEAAQRAAMHRGPMFRRPIAIEPGVVVKRDGFVFADVVPRDATGRSFADAAISSAEPRSR